MDSIKTEIKFGIINKSAFNLTLGNKITELAPELVL
jgi:hypothetical protein